jgi:hypothetical protein
MFSSSSEDPFVNGETFPFPLMVPFSQCFPVLMGEVVIGCDLALGGGSSRTRMDVSAVKSSRNISNSSRQSCFRIDSPGSLGSSLMISS